MTAVHFALGQSKWLTAMRENSPRAIRAHLRTVQAGEGIFALLERRCFPAIPSVQNATRRPPAPTVITGANPVAPATVLGSTKRPSTKATAPTQASPAGATIAAVGNKASYATAAVAAPKAKAKTQVKAKTKVEAETPVKSKTPAKAGTKATKAIKATKATAVVRASAKTPASPSGMTKENTDFLIERLEAQAGVIRTILPKAERLEQANLELKAENESAAAAVIKAQTAACIAFVAATALAIKAPSRIKRVRSALQATHRAARVHRANVAHKFRLAYQRPAVQHYSVLFSVWMRKGFRAAKFLAKTFLQGVGVGSTLILLSFLDYYYARQIKERHIQDQAVVAEMEMQKEILRQEEEIRLRMQQQEIAARDAEAKELASLNAYELAEREHKAKAPWGSNPEDTKVETPRIV